MEIEDFLPKYPFVEETPLNPYPNQDINNVIYHKQEFYENRLPLFEPFPKDRGGLTRNQRTITRLMSSHTPIPALLLVHAMGVGKTCSAIGSVEQVRKENSTISGALILAKNENIIKNFINELVFKCTAGEYLPENIASLTSNERDRRIKKKVEEFYSFNTFEKFAKKIKKMTDNQIQKEYSNTFVVIDEVHNLRDQENSSEDTYPYFHRFLHLITNCKILMMSGTPMKDTPEEIASILNLILPMEQQLPVGKKFLDEYTINKGGRTLIRDDKIQTFKQALKGRVSFLRETPSSIPRKYVGRKYQDLSHLIVNPVKMSQFQTEGYIRAYKADKNENNTAEEQIKRGAAYTYSKEASLFVYPDGSSGTDGYNKYIVTSDVKSIVQDVKSYKMNKELTLAIEGKDTADTLQKIKKYSATYADTLQRILNTKGCCFVYSNSVTGSGAILFSLLLEKVGFSKASGSETTSGLRYISLVNKNSREIRKLLTGFNNPRNLHGEYIKVIIGSRAISEGFSFQNIILEEILTPWWNYSETSQAIARGIRFGSHDALIKAGERPVVTIAQQVAVPDADIPSVDLLAYKRSEDKDINIQYIMRLIMEASIDCALNYKRNHVVGFDNQRECDYMDCDYQCDDVAVKDLVQEEIDYSTYNLYYTKPTSIDLRRKIEDLFRMNPILDVPSIVKALKSKHNEDEILVALQRLSQEETSFSYKTFLGYYGETPVQKITIELEKLFSKYFSMDLYTIVKQVGGYTLPEVLITLDTLINENRRVKNKYGFDCYIREQNNVYFLVNGISDEPSMFSVYYTQYPSIQERHNFGEIINNLATVSLPKVIEKLFETKNEAEIVKLIATLSPEVQNLLLQSAIYAERENISKDKNTRKVILEYFKGYIKKVGTTFISTLSGELRCLEDGKGWETWGECKGEVKAEYNRLLEEKMVQLRQNPYGFYGKENPENKKFCIVDLIKEKKSLEEKDYDTRLKLTGKVCSEGGFNINDLMMMVIRRAKIPAPLDFMIGISVENLRNKVRADIRDDPKSKLKDLYKIEEITNLSETELRSALYWGTKKEGGVRSLDILCRTLRDWMENEGILELDNQCGVQGKKKQPKEKEEKKEKAKKDKFRVETIPANDPRLKPFMKSINKNMEICFDMPYKVNTKDKNNWILVISGKRTLAGMLMIDENNYIWNVCVAPKFRKQGVAKQAIGEALGNMCSIKGNLPTLLVDNKGVNKDNLIKMYESFGFTIVGSDEKYTSMRHSC